MSLFPDEFLDQWCPILLAETPEDATPGQLRAELESIRRLSLHAFQNIAAFKAEREAVVRLKASKTSPKVKALRQSITDLEKVIYTFDTRMANQLKEQRASLLRMRQETEELLRAEREKNSALLSERDSVIVGLRGKIAQLNAENASLMARPKLSLWQKLWTPTHQL